MTFDIGIEGVVDFLGLKSCSCFRDPNWNFGYWFVICCGEAACTKGRVGAKSCTLDLEFAIAAVAKSNPL